MKALGMLLVSLLLCVAVSAQGDVVAGQTQIVKPDKAVRLTIESMLNVRAIRGPDWEIRRHKDNKGLWRALLSARDAVVTDLGDAGDQESHIRFAMWPIDADHPELLVVLRYSGGAHCCDALDIFALKENFRTVLDISPFQFTSLEDLNTDAIPEVLGRSLAFDYAFGLSHADSYLPPLVFGYYPKAKQYRCLNLTFANTLRAQSVNSRATFEKHAQSTTQFAYVKGNLKNAEPFSLLMRSVLDLIYLGEEVLAYEYLEQHITSETYAWVKHELDATLVKDPHYQEMLKYRP